jgi:hypothetical protein
VELVPRTDRDVVLARLSRPVTKVPPIGLASAGPAAGEELKFTGYGRTASEWAPLKAGVAACAGDAGGPVFREASGKATLVGLNSRSYQGGCFGTDPAETRTDGLVTRVDDLGAWVNSVVGATRITDFNGDGVEDIAIADPKAAVGGKDGAGLVRIVYGGGRGTTSVNQDLDWVPGGSEEGDWFGESIDTVDYNQDGYTDLVVGTPSEDLDKATDAGMVDVLYGAPGGIGTGSVKDTHFEQDTGTGSIAGSAPETGDRMGQAVAAGTTASGEPFLVIGVPGEAIGSVPKAGMAFYVRDSTSVGITTANVGITQDSSGVPGAVEANDAFGSSVAADANHFAIGAPNEAIGTDAAAGKADAGNVITLRISAAGSFTQLNVYSSGTASDDVVGTSEAGDRFGQTLAAVNTSPAAVSSAATMKLAVGAPGEAVGTAAKAGAVTTFSLLGSPGAADRWIEAGTAGIPGPAGAGQQLGTSLHYTGTQLYVGMPYGPAAYGALHALPMSNATAGGPNAAVTTYQPGQSGLPAAGGRFGYPAR